MADYFSQFSCILDVGTADNARAAEAVRHALAAEIEEAEGCDLGFEMAHDPGHLLERHPLQRVVDRAAA
jgi:hypothetical protein